MKRGRLIALEGGEGSGKSTQARLLHASLTDRGLNVVLTREPGGTPGAEAIREILLQQSFDTWNPQAEALLFAAARADHVEKIIRPALDEGHWVVTDRFVDSSRAYQGVARLLGDLCVQELHRIGSGGLRPDLTIVLDVDERTSIFRQSQRDGATADAIGSRDASYHAKVRQAFRDFAADDGSIVVIDGTAPQQTVQAQIIDTINDRLCAR